MKPYEVISERRKDRGMPVSELARRAGIEYEALRVSLEGGRNIRADEFVELCRILDLDLNDFEHEAVAS